jgi:3-oxoacyl-[acyl-carrier-protein] synthase-3
VIHAEIAGVGAYLPRRTVTNEELARTVDTSDEWIVERTGIRERHIAEADETACFMATRAARAALEFAGVNADQVDAIIVATSTPDQVFPAVALRVQAELGITRGFGFDLSAACSGFVYALSVADQMMRAGNLRHVLVIGVEVFSRLVDWKDRGTCVLFGDGAGAVLLCGTKDSSRGIISTHLHADGRLGDILYTNGAIGRPDLPGTVVMHGRDVFRHAVVKLAECVEEALAENHLNGGDIDWLVPHQANLRIIEAMGKKLGLPPERVVITVDRHGNTSAASIPLAFNEAVRDGRIKRGDLVLMDALGAGLTWGSVLLRF